MFPWAFFIQVSVIGGTGEKTDEGIGFHPTRIAEGTGGYSYLLTIEIQEPQKEKRSTVGAREVYLLCLYQLSEDG